jgi:hypothetical protein
LAAFLGCSDHGPRPVLDAYREALAKKDAARIRGLSDRAFKDAMSEDELRVYLDSDPGAADRLGRDLRSKESEPFESADITLDNGKRIHFVKEGGAWRLAEGGLEAARFDTPEHALSTFFAAADAGRWRMIRAAIPKRFQDALASDDALSHHIAAMQKRIERARSELGALNPGRAEVRGDKAVLAYGKGKRVTFEREDGAWRILDLE